MESQLSTRITEYDAVVVGANYAGLITGAILSRNGLKVLVVDELDQIGGRLGGILYHGYWLDWGHRDTRDFADCFVVITDEGQYSRKAAEAAGADVALVGPIKPMVLGYLTDGRLVPMSADPEDQVRFINEVLGLSHDQGNEFLLTQMDLMKEDPQKLLAVTLKEWLPTVGSEAVREAFGRIANILYAEPLEECSLGRFVNYLKNPMSTYKINDPEVGGQQGLMEPYARVIRKNGGEIKLGLQTAEIVVEDNRVTGVVVRDKTNTVQEFRAPVVVFNFPIWDVFEVLDESYFPPQVVENARKLKTEYRGDIVCLNIGVSRLPTIRATGQPDTYIGFNQSLDETGGWYIPSLSSEKQAPPGKHLLSIDTGWEEPCRSFRKAKTKADRVREYMRRYYSDLDEITEWASYQWIRAWATASHWMPTPRSPLKVDGLDGLYFVGFSVEVDGLYQDVEANSALQASQLILEATTATA